jgi:transposase
MSFNQVINRLKYYGVSGRAMIEANINGVNDPKTLSSLAKRGLKKKKDDLERALVGSVGPH